MGTKQGPEVKSTVESREYFKVCVDNHIFSIVMCSTGVHIFTYLNYVSRGSASGICYIIICTALHNCSSSGSLFFTNDVELLR